MNMILCVIFVCVCMMMCDFIIDSRVGVYESCAQFTSSHKPYHHRHHHHYISSSAEYYVCDKMLI